MPQFPHLRAVFSSLAVDRAKGVGAKSSGPPGASCTRVPAWPRWAVCCRALSTQFHQTASQRAGWRLRVVFWQKLVVCGSFGKDFVWETKQVMSKPRGQAGDQGTPGRQPVSWSVFFRVLLLPVLGSGSGPASPRGGASPCGSSGSRDLTSARPGSGASGSGPGWHSGLGEHCPPCQHPPR